VFLGVVQVDLAYFTKPGTVCVDTIQCVEMP
jgi:hypothetical protein